MKNDQLWGRTDDRCELVFYAHRAGAPAWTFGDVRVLFWPHGHPCWPANMYVASLLKRGRTVGTVNCAAAELSLFLKFLHGQRKRFDEVGDSDLHAFSQVLVSEPHRFALQSRRRGGRQINKVIRRALNFLAWYEALFPQERLLVGEHGTGAKVTVEERKLYKKDIEVAYLWHDSMVSEDVPRDVKPMARDVLLSLLHVCQKFAKRSFVRARARAMLKLLADTGARRSEIVSIKVDLILEAARKGSTKLLLRTAKRGDWMGREVPIPRSTLDAVVSYIEVERKHHVRSLIKSRKLGRDPGWLFLALSGDQLDTETITQDIARLRRIANVSERATAHMLRHRWITIQVIERLKAYVGHRLPLDVATTILTKVASLTGHKKLGSLWKYIDLAFDEMGIWDTAEAVINMRINAEAAHRELAEIREVHKGGTPLGRKEIHRIDELLTDLLTHVKPEFVEVASRRVDLQRSLGTYMGRPSVLGSHVG